MRLRILTWNINSIRKRLDLLHELVRETAPDVVCLQETKVRDDLFPHDACAAMDFPHRAVAGMRGYNGVAILSRLPFRETGREDWCERDDARHVSAVLDLSAAGARPVELHNFYVPAGGDDPDPDFNPKFAHKLDYLSGMADWGAGLSRRGRRRVLVGDLNVAPLETDVWSHRQLRNVVSHTEIEIDHLERAREAHGWIDAMREIVPPEERLYTWWSYRARDWAAADRGRRLDHVWISRNLRPALAGIMVLREVRDWAGPSDHAPVMLDLEP